MPEVNGKKFAYTTKGRAAAKKFAKKTGKNMVSHEKVSKSVKKTMGY